MKSKSSRALLASLLTAALAPLLVATARADGSQNADCAGLSRRVSARNRRLTGCGRPVRPAASRRHSRKRQRLGLRPRAARQRQGRLLPTGRPRLPARTAQPAALPVQGRREPCQGQGRARVTAPVSETIRRGGLAMRSLSAFCRRSSRPIVGGDPCVPVVTRSTAVVELRPVLTSANHGGSR